MKIYEIKQPEEVQKQACFLDNLQDLNFKLRILSLIKKILLILYLLPKLWNEQIKIGHTSRK